MPALALLIAWVLLRPTVTPALGVACVAVLLALRLAQVIPSYGVSPEPWKPATAYVLKSTPADRPACIAFYPQDGREVFDYYLLRTAGGAAGNPAPVLRPVLPTLALGHGQALRRALRHARCGPAGPHRRAMPAPLAAREP